MKKFLIMVVFVLALTACNKEEVNTSQQNDNGAGQPVVGERVTEEMVVEEEWSHTVTVDEGQGSSSSFSVSSIDEE